MPNKNIRKDSKKTELGTSDKRLEAVSKIVILDPASHKDFISSY
jgi:hypothetical protein